MTDTNEGGAPAPAASDTPAAEAPAADATALGAADAQNNEGGEDNAQPAKDSNEGDSSQEKGSESDGENQNDQESNTPTEYEDFTLPENMEVNEAVMGEFKGALSEIEKELGQALPQAAAQKFVDMGANIAQQAVENFIQQSTEQQAQRTEEWINTFKNDPELGGTEEVQQATLSEAKRVVTALGGDALVNAINETGAGNHPEIIRAFHKLKDVVGEDGKVVLSNQGGGSKTLANTLYPNQT